MQEQLFPIFLLIYIKKITNLYILYIELHNFVILIEAAYIRPFAIVHTC